MPAALGAGILVERVGSAFLALSKKPDHWGLLPLEGDGSLVLRPVFLSLLNNLVEG